MVGTCIGAPARLRVPLLLLVALQAVSFVSVNIFLPSIPSLVTEFSTSVTRVMQALTVYLAGLGISQLIYGPISDRFGRKPPVLAGLVLFTIGSCACASSTSITQFLIWRFVQALGGGAGATLGRAMIRDVHGSAKSASMIGYTVMATTVASGLAPIVGSLLDTTFGWRSTFVFLAALGAASFILALFGTAETLRKRGREITVATSTSYYTILRSGYFRVHALYAIFLFASWYGFVASVPIVVVTLWHLTSGDFATWWTFGSVCYVIGNYIAGRYSQTRGNRRMIVKGSVLVAIGAILLLAGTWLDVHHPAILFLPMGVLLVGFGMSQPCATAASLDAVPAFVGSASALLGSLQIIGAMASVSLIGMLAVTQVIYFVAPCALLALAAVASYWLGSPGSAQCVPAAMDK